MHRSRLQVNDGARLSLEDEAAINVAEKATLDARGTDSLQLSNKTAVNLQKDARMMWQGIEFSNKGDADKATLTNSGSGAYGLGSTDYVLTDGYARYTGSDATLRTQLAHSEEEHAGAGGSVRPPPPQVSRLK